MKFFRYMMVLSILLGQSINAKEVTINFQNTPIMDVVMFVAKQHNKNILINQAISGNVNFVSNKPIDHSELIPLLEHILRVKGFSLSKSSDGYYEIIKATSASKEIAIDSKNEIGMQIEILRPQFIKPSVVSAKIKHLASPYALITSDDKMNILLVTDYPKNLNNIKKLLTLFDTHLKRELQMVTLEHYHVNIAVKKLQEIFKLTEDQYKGDISLLGAEYQNAIWVSANSEDMEKVIKAIKFFDNQAKDNVKTTTKIIFLKNANAEDIIKTVQTIATSLDTNNPIKTVVSSNKELNSIIISSSLSQITQLTNLIQQIDIERRQVFVKVQMYEISNNTVENMGIKWGLAAGYADDTSIATSSVDMGGSYFALPDVLADSINLDAVNKGLAVGAVIDLIKGDGGVNTLSEPNLLCLNNITSSLYVGKTQSILTSSATGDSTTDLTRNTYSREDIGLKVEITPQIADKDKVVLKVKSTIEDVDTSTDADRPTTTKREIDSTTIVQNGETIIIGGLIRDYQSTSKTKVPFLGDIPFLGALFRSSSETNDKISLVIMMTPYIVNNSLELEEIQKKLEELNMQKVKLTKRIKKALDDMKNADKVEAENEQIEKEKAAGKSEEEITNMTLHEQRVKMLLEGN